MKGCNCVRKEEKPMFKKTEDVVLKLYSISGLIDDSK